jgi:hypothetical protein
MKNQITRVSACLALLVVSGYFASPGYVQAELGTTLPVAQFGTSVMARPAQMECAKATVVNGNVVKAIPDKQNRIVANVKTPCKVGDLLPNGSVVQTGKETKSFAELKWGTGKITRIWKDSIVRVFCRESGRVDTVCVLGGSMLFRKDHKDPEDPDQWVETKLLQARIHGTTVTVHVLPYETKFKVVEGGPVFTKNKVTGEVKEISAGTELVVSSKGRFKSDDKRFEVPSLISYPKNFGTK